MPLEALAQTVAALSGPAPGAMPALPAVWFVLPAYNEEANLGALLAAIEQAAIESARPHRVVVVDDGSTDGTVACCERAQLRIPVELLRHERNSGLGVTLRDGLQHAVARADGEDIIITMDADMSHPPALTRRMVDAIAEGRDVVVASRFQPGAIVEGVPAHRQALSLGASWLFRVVRPVRGVRDYTCGYRAYRVSALRKAFALHGPRLVESAGFDCMVEILMKLRPLGLVFGEVPLVLRYDWKGGVSKMRVWRTALRLLRRAVG